jgi:hypothetical protein
MRNALRLLACGNSSHGCCDTTKRNFTETLLNKLIELNGQWDTLTTLSVNSEENTSFLFSKQQSGWFECGDKKGTSFRFLADENNANNTAFIRGICSSISPTMYTGILKGWKVVYLQHTPPTVMLFKQGDKVMHALANMHTL